MGTEVSLVEHASGLAPRIDARPHCGAPAATAFPNCSPPPIELHSESLRGAVMTADQLLQEAIIELQKRDLTPETRHVVDEAARLLLDGRDIEARALIEKAQAITVPRTPTDGESPQTDQLAPVNGRMAPSILSRFGGRLALQIESALNETV